MPRRGENIRKRKDGRWEGRYSFCDAVSGKRRTRSVYAKTYGEVRTKLATAKEQAAAKQQAMARQQTTAKERAAAKQLATAEERAAAKQQAGEIRKPGNRAADQITFGEAAGEWLKRVEETKKYATYIKYGSVYRKYLGDRLGAYPVAGLVEEEVRNVLEEAIRQEEKLLSESLCRSIYGVLNQVLEYADLHYRTDSPRFEFRKPHGSGKNIEVLNHTEQAALLRWLYTDIDVGKLGILLCISTGLRLGEICSLKWENIDFKEKVLHVNSTVQRIAVEGMQTKTALLEGKPKSIFSEREIPISEELTRLMEPFYRKDGYVLKDSGPMEPRTYQKRFQRYLAAAGVERKNFHILRHTFATNCIDNGTDVKSLSEILGHSDVRITLNRYVHPTIETKRQHLNSLSAVYGQYLGQNPEEVR